MKVLNINNSYLNTQRFGWNKIINILQNSISNDDIILIDFIDKYFDPWLYQEKIIICNNIKYSFYNKDAYYDENDMYKNDIFVYKDNLNLKTVIKWFPEYNEFKILRGKLTINLKKKYTIDNIDKPWVGIVHYPEFTKEMNYESYEYFKNIVSSYNFLKSINKCICIITLSQWLQSYIEMNLEKYNIYILVKTIYHPTDFNCIKFNYNNYINNKSKKIIQIGYWMRKYDTIYKIKTDLIKYWLPGGNSWKEIFSQMYPETYMKHLEDNSVIIKTKLSNDDYDKLLSENLVLLNVFNSSANNTILECIARNTPIFVNKHSAIVEYLRET